MPVSVVDVLEVVEVDHQQREDATFPRIRAFQLSMMISERAAVQQTGQRIVIRGFLGGLQSLHRFNNLFPGHGEFLAKRPGSTPRVRPSDTGESRNHS